MQNCNLNSHKHLAIVKEQKEVILAVRSASDPGPSCVPYIVHKWCWMFKYISEKEKFGGEIEL